MLIVGERINASRQSIADAIVAKDEAFIKKEALDQQNAGAHLVDVNAGIFVGEEAKYLRWLVQTIQQSEAEIHLCIDTSDARAMAEALSVHKGRAMVNSITDEANRYQKMISVIKDFRPQVVVLCIDDNGIPSTSEGRFLIASRLIEKLTREGIFPEDIYIDPLVMPLSIDTNNGIAVLETLEKLSKSFPEVNTICGLSNISYGLPSRGLCNQIFLVAAIMKGLKAVILDPLDKRIMANLITTLTLLGRDAYCSGYLSAFRKGSLNL